MNTGRGLDARNYSELQSKGDRQERGEGRDCFALPLMDTSGPHCALCGAAPVHVPSGTRSGASVTARSLLGVTDLVSPQHY